MLGGMAGGVVVIGGGPAGMTAAIFAAARGARVTLLERNEKLGKKLYITGKGRCNLTNTAGADELQSSIPRGGRFLMSALSAFGSKDVREWFESLGVPTVEERGGRVFPASGKASDITRALTRAMNARGVRVSLGARVSSIVISSGRVAGVLVEGGKRLDCGAAIIATGGMSYPATGSTGDGYRLAEAIGHTITPTRPSLVPLISSAQWVRSLQGLSLRNVTLSASSGGKRVMSEMGELLFTHFGISGPLALTLSSRAPDNPGAIESIAITLDLKPALSLEQLDARLLRVFADNPRKRLDTVMCSLLPSRLAASFPDLCGISAARTPSAISRAERAAIAQKLKALPLPVSGFTGFEDAVITRGGVDVKEIDPRTMESKLAGGLYFAGEVIDADALTGGFNLQIAFSTGAKAGAAAATPSAPAPSLA